MPLLPFDTFSLETPLAPGEVRARLAAAVEPKRRLRLGGGRCPFEGEVEGDSFRVSRVINYRNSFLPHVRGRVHRRGEEGARNAGGDCRAGGPAARRHAAGHLTSQ